MTVRPKITIAFAFAVALAAQTKSIETTFHDAVMPVGVQDGKNTAFNLPVSPTPIRSLMLVKNGLIQKQGLDFSLRAATITFISVAAPQRGDVVQAWFRSGGSSANASIIFVDGEVPNGLLNGVNGTFALSAAPNPMESAILTKNGLVQQLSEDFTIQGSRVIFNKKSIPSAKDSLLIWYRGRGATSFVK